MTASSILLIVFILVSLAHLAVEAAGSITGRYITKPLLMPVLALYYVASAAQPNLLLVAAILLGWIGDVFLMLPESEKKNAYFKAGLAAFLLGHILYVVVFAAYLPHLSSVPAWGLIALAVFVATGVAGYKLIVPHAGKLLPVIIAYIVIIFLMGVSTILPLGTVAACGAVTAMAGAFFFMVSDTINAYNKFAREIPGERLLTMGTYIAGQFLLVQGYLLF